MRSRTGLTQDAVSGPVMLTRLGGEAKQLRATASSVGGLVLIFAQQILMFVLGDGIFDDRQVIAISFEIPHD
jgi:hypothetical protein